MVNQLDSARVLLCVLRTQLRKTFEIIAAYALYEFTPWYNANAD